MSRGSGRIESAIRELFAANPDLAFSVVDLVEHCFPDSDPERNLEKRHSVSVIRAAHKVVAKDPDWTIWRGETQGGALVFVNQASLQSHCLGWLMSDVFYYYRSPKRANRAYLDEPTQTRADLLALLAPDGRKHDILERRKKFVDLHIAERDGDEERAGEIRARMEAYKAKLFADTKAMFGKGASEG